MIEQILSYKTLFFSIVTTLSCALLPATNKSLYTALIIIYTNRGDPVFHSCYDGIIAETYHLAVLTSTVWFSITVQQTLMNVSRCHLFCLEEFSDTHLLHTHFYVRHHFVRLPLCCHLSNGNKMQWSIGEKVQPLTLLSNIIK